MFNFWVLKLSILFFLLSSKDIYLQTAGIRRIGPYYIYAPMLARARAELTNSSMSTSSAFWTALL